MDSETWTTPLPLDALTLLVTSPSRLVLCLLASLCLCLPCFPARRKSAWPAHAYPAPAAKHIGIKIGVSSAQPHSPLLRLPPELRALIWEAALGARHFDLSLAVVRAPAGSSATPTVVRAASADLLPTALLRTCRLVHAEAAHALYAHNTFRAPAWALPAIILAAPRLRDVREVVLYHAARSVVRPGPGSGWPAAVQALREMRVEGLQVELDRMPVLAGQDEADEWVSVLAGVRGLRRFDLTFRNSCPSASSPAADDPTYELPARLCALLVSPGADAAYALLYEAREQAAKEAQDVRMREARELQEIADTRKGRRISLGLGLSL
ncbi:hypothetical protein B0H15DRAFT_945060 [Mycena belliarum]|uniref:DUF7730 domain-containing protein n=1 Tax=Mycena belliarum TaxID=1033014 RepID=A0AAD6XVB7_9AGAR|nr:hypothetical protein B0H15DRAFT_945060 [Mycena belliae]